MSTLKDSFSAAPDDLDPARTAEATRLRYVCDAMPGIRRRRACQAGPGLPRSFPEKVLATVVRLLEVTLIRVGNQETGVAGIHV